MSIKNNLTTLRDISGSVSIQGDFVRIRKSDGAIDTKLALYFYAEELSGYTYLGPYDKETRMPGFTMYYLEDGCHQNHYLDVRSLATKIKELQEECRKGKEQGIRAGIGGIFHLVDAVNPKWELHEKRMAERKAKNLKFRELHKRLKQFCGPHEYIYQRRLNSEERRELHEIIGKNHLRLIHSLPN